MATQVRLVFCGLQSQHSESVEAQLHLWYVDTSWNWLYFNITSGFSQNKRKKHTCLIIYLFPTHFAPHLNNRENIKCDLWGLDLLTPVFHWGNHSRNCFWGVPNPFTLYFAFQSCKHDLYLTHVLISSSFMSEQCLWLFLFGVDIAFEFGTLRDGWLIWKTALFLIFYFSRSSFTNTIYISTSFEWF